MGETKYALVKKPEKQGVEFGGMGGSLYLTYG
jgi:hypothetical protein